MSGDLATFDHVLFFGRSYKTVLNMLLLTEDYLKGKRILDCPSGPDSFVAGAYERGIDVVGCDPLFGGSAEDVASTARRDILDAFKGTLEEPVSSAGVSRTIARDEKLAATEAFSRDFDRGKAEGRYLEAALPNLPFSESEFDIAVCANFLFAYSPARYGGVLESDTFDLAFHIRSVRELMRVSREEVRLYPVLTIEKNQHLHPYAAQIIGQLAAEGITINLEDSVAEQDGIMHQVLIIKDYR